MMQITFQHVGIAELPKAVFPSVILEIRMDHVRAKFIRKDAFCAMMISSVIISNASITEIQSGAFSERTLIQSLEFADVEIKNIHAAAFRANHDNLTIRYSRFASEIVLWRSSLQPHGQKARTAPFCICQFSFLLSLSFLGFYFMMFFSLHCVFEEHPRAFVTL